MRSNFAGPFHPSSHSGGHSSRPVLTGKDDSSPIDRSSRNGGYTLDPGDTELEGFPATHVRDVPYDGDEKRLPLDLPG